MSQLPDPSEFREPPEVMSPIEVMREFGLLSVEDESKAPKREPMCDNCDKRPVRHYISAENACPVYCDSAMCCECANCDDPETCEDEADWPNLTDEELNRALIDLGYDVGGYGAMHPASCVSAEMRNEAERYVKATR